jgi:hypothetical protein
MVKLKEIPSISKEIEYVVKEGSPSEKVFGSELTNESSIQIGKNNDSKMLRNTPISPVIKADAESDEVLFLRQYSFYSAVCSIE